MRLSMQGNGHIGRSQVWEVDPTLSPQGRHYRFRSLGALFWPWGAESFAMLVGCVAP